MFQNKSSSFAGRPRVAVRQALASNENATAKTFITTRSQALKDLKDPKLANPAKLSSALSQPKNLHPSEKSINPKLTKPTALGHNQSSQVKTIPVPVKKTTKVASGIPNVVVTRSKSVSVSVSSRPHTQGMPEKQSQLNRPSSAVVTQPATNNALKPGQVNLPRPIAKPSSIMGQRRQLTKPSYSFDGGSASATDVSSNRVHAVRRSNSTLSTCTNKSGNSTTSDSMTYVGSKTQTSSTASVHSSLSLCSSETQLSSKVSISSHMFDQIMDVDLSSEDTIISASDNEGDILVIEESDTEDCDMDNQLKNIEFSEESGVVEHALNHTGLSGELPITVSEIRSFESDVDPYDTTLVPCFSDDIFEYMRELEVKFMPDCDYMDRQSELSWPMRSILIDWLVQVHERFRLLPETLFLTINLVDRFLSIKPVQMQKVQLVGAVALLIASKYEEIQIPSVNEIVYMTENAFTIDDVIRAERFVLRILNFDMGWPGPMSFLRRISKADDYDLPTRTLAKYLLEVTLMHEYFINVPCSKIAAVAHYLSIRFLGKNSWSRAHAFYSGCFESELIPLLPNLIDILSSPKKHKAIFEKYSDRKYMRASDFVAQWFARNNIKTLLTPTNTDLSPSPLHNSL